ncbi:hypothetical protein GX865_02890 [Candidatus Saccharibacteria bacterium]|nr:hypothetical protein [Candidatus Saccharibacteria bacterium]
MSKPANTIPKVKKPLHIRYRIEKIIFYILWIVSSILILRILFFLLGANREAPFIEWLYNFSSIFVIPFVGIFKTPEYGISVIDLASVVAIFIYFILAMSIVKLINVTNIKR